MIKIIQARFCYLSRRSISSLPREGYLKNGAAHLLADLPGRVLKSIEKLSKQTGESAAAIVEKGVELYRRSVRKAEPGLNSAEDDLDAIRRDPTKGPIFEEIMKAIRGRSAASMTPEQRTARAQAGAASRFANMTAEEKKELAKKAAKKRWMKPPPTKGK